MTTQPNDQLLICTDCNKQFIFTEGEQTFFATKGLTNLPKRCPDCRVLMRAFRKGLFGTTANAMCTKCGATCRVPFIPKGHSPIYCNACRYKGQTTGQVVPVCTTPTAG